MDFSSNQYALLHTTHSPLPNLNTLPVHHTIFARLASNQESR